MIVKVPNWIKVFWIIVLPGLIMFLGRMTYEYIYLIYKNGPQMIGFSLIHLYPILFIIMILSYLSSIIWILIYTSWMIRTVIEKNRPDGMLMYLMTLIIVVFIFLLEPISKTLY